MMLLKGNGNYSHKVVGVTHNNYQDTLRSLAGPRVPDGYDVNLLAALKFEDGNKYDPNAIGVILLDVDNDQGAQIGYIAQKQTAKFRSRFAEIGVPDGEFVFCRAKIVGGMIYDSIQKEGDIYLGPIGVRLDLRFPLILDQVPVSGE